MKRVLLVGVVDSSIQNILNELQLHFQVQISAPVYHNVNGMVRITTPDMVVIYQSRLDDIPPEIVTKLGSDFPNLPIMIVCATEEYGFFKPYCETGQFHFLFKPFTKTKLSMKCKQIFGEDVCVVDSGEGTEDAFLNKLSKMVGDETIMDSSQDEKSEEKKGTKLARILAIDDSPLILRSFKVMLEEQFEIRLAFSGEKGLWMIHDFDPDIIFLDYEMPKMNGVELFRHLKRIVNMREVPVVFLTGIAEKEKIIQVLAEHPAGYLLKPVDKNKLLDTIERILHVKVERDEEE